MGHTWLCFFSISPLALLPGSHTGSIWNLLAPESHRAIKPSKAHKRTRGRTSNNVGPTSCQQTQCIVNLNKPCCSFFILAFSVCLFKRSRSQTPPGTKNFTFLPLNGIGTDAERIQWSWSDWDHRGTNTICVFPCCITPRAGFPRTTYQTLLSEVVFILFTISSLTD